MPSSASSRRHATEHDARSGATPAAVERPRGLLHVLRSDRWLLIGLMGLLTVALLPVAVMIRTTDDIQSAREQERYGSTIARRLAAAALDPLIAGDRISLSAMTKEFTRLPEVAASAVYGADDQLLAASDDGDDSPRALSRATSRAASRGVFVQQVTLQETIAGYVRIELDPVAFARPERARVWLAMLLAAAAALVLGHWQARRLQRALGALAGALDGEPADLTERSELARMYDALLPEPSRTSSEREAAPTSDGHPLYLLVVNLYNPVSLNATEREDVLELCGTLLEQVCRLYSGRTEPLPGTGLLAVFDADPRHDDHAFQALCVGLLTRRLLQFVNHDRLRHGDVELTFRIAVDTITPQQDARLDGAVEELFPEAIERAVMLSSVAREDRLAVSGAVLQACDNTDRLIVEALDDSILRALADDGDASSAYACLIADLAPGYRELLDRQARLLLTHLQPDADEPSSDTPG